MSKFAEKELHVAAGTIFHNKPAELKRMLYSMPRGCIDYWFLIGGAFAESPDKERIINQETLDVIYGFETDQMQYDDGIKVVWTVLLDSNEFSKRMKYLDLCRQYDVNCLLIIDSDEYVYENMRYEWMPYEKNAEKFRRYCYSNMIKYPEHNVYSLNIIQNEYLQKDLYPRVWMYPDQMAYVRGSHYKFGNPYLDKVEDVMFTHQASFGAIEGITFKHDHTLRSDVDMKNRRVYQDWLVEYEAALESDYDIKTLGEIRADAAKSIKPFNDGCMCFKCVKTKGLDPEFFFDPRPKDKRIFDPYITGIPL